MPGAATLPTAGPAPVPAPGAIPPAATANPLASTFARGIDISTSAGEPTPQDFDKIRQQGYRFVIVAGWGGVNPNRHAQVQLRHARNAGLLTAGYCYLNFASSLDGARQVDEALGAFDIEAAHLGFVAIDVETSARNQLTPGLRAEVPDPAAQQRAIVRISEAVEKVRRVGLRAVIYTKKDDWQQVTGDTQQFKHLALWHPKTIGGDDIHQPPLTSPQHTFGGWVGRVGKQFELDKVLTDPRIAVDLDVFDLNAFSVSSRNDKQPADIPMAALEK